MNRKTLLELLEKHRNGTITDAEQQLLSDWMDAVAEDAAGEDIPTAEKEELKKDTWRQITKARKPAMRVVLRRTSIAAAIAGLLVAGYFLRRERPAAQQPLLSWQTGVGEIREISLPDHSKVVLGPRTRITYAGKPGKRHITVLEGKALFDVVKDPSSPFTVTSCQTTTTVLGTTFTVEALPAMQVSRIILITGKVKVADYGVLQPAQRMTVVEQKRHAMTDSVSSEDALAWTRGEILLRNAGLHEVIKTLEDNYRIRVRTTLDTRQGNYTLRFPASMPLKEVLDVMQKISYKPKIRFTMEKDLLTIY